MIFEIKFLENIYYGIVNIVIIYSLVVLFFIEQGSQLKEGSAITITINIGSFGRRIGRFYIIVRNRSNNNKFLTIAKV